MSNTPRLLVLNSSCLEVVEDHRVWIEAEGVQLLAEQAFRHLNPEQAAALLRDADAVILPAASLMPLNGSHLAGAPRLLVCSIAASGYEWFDIEAATQHGIVVSIAAGGEGAEVVADLTWGLMLAVARQIPYRHQLICEGKDQRGMGTSVFGKTLGIIGLGNIGRAVVRRARGFNMRILASDPHPDEAFVCEHGVQLVPQDELLEQADFVSLHLRLCEATSGILGRRELLRMKPTAYLLNTARKGLVDEEALVAAILEKRIAGAGLDDPPGGPGKKLLGLPNVVFTPHLGNRAIEGVHGVLRLAVENALAVLHGQRPRFLVNPEVYQGRLRRNPWLAEDSNQPLQLPPKTQTIL